MSYKVLYVEDDFQLQALMRAMFHQTDYQLLEADDADTGYQAVLEHMPNLILMDINLPGGSGVEVIRRIKQEPSIAQIPVIAITADDSRENREQCFAAGCVTVLLKPVPRLLLLDTIRKYLENGTQNAAVTTAQQEADKRKKVLVVDDHEDLRIIFSRAFNRHHFDVSDVGNGSDALRYMRDNLPDVVILDINMPGLSGYDVLAVIRNDERLKDTKVILVTGNTLASEDPQSQEADLLLIKPVDISRLFEFAKQMMTS